MNIFNRSFKALDSIKTSPNLCTQNLSPQADLPSTCFCFHRARERERERERESSQEHNCLQIYVGDAQQGVLEPSNIPMGLLSPTWGTTIIGPFWAAADGR